VVDSRFRREAANGVYLLIVTDALPVVGELPHRDLVDAVIDRLGLAVLDVVLVADDRWWSYRCQDPACCPPAGRAIDPHSRGATAVAAAYAFAGHGVLADRDAVVRSIGYDGGDEAAMNRLVAGALRRQGEQRQSARRAAVRGLLQQLTAALVDPRGSVDEQDAAELAALCHDPIVRDEVLVRAVDSSCRAELLPVLRAVARRVPPPHDAPICATLAWVAYAGGDGAIANVALDRALSTDPDYSLALLIADALDRQIAPAVLEEVMRAAARDLRPPTTSGSRRRR
jgi:Domain of unknown function (DUF4192)